MKTLIAAGAAGLLLFAASAGVSWYLFVAPTGKPEPAEGVATTEMSNTETTPTLSGTEKPEQMPVAIRPQMPLTLEAVLELSESIRKKERELLEREAAAEKADENVRLLFEDLKLERAEIQAMLDTLEARLQVTQDSVTHLKEENQTLAAHNQELAKLKQQTGATVGEAGALDELAQRVKTAKPWFEGLEDEQAANYLKEFANNGDLKFAARLLQSLQQRKASKILAAFNDPEFVQQILDALAAEKDANQASEGDGVAELRGRPIR